MKRAKFIELIAWHQLLGIPTKPKGPSHVNFASLPAPLVAFLFQTEDFFRAVLH